MATTKEVNVFSGAIDMQRNAIPIPPKPPDPHNNPSTDSLMTTTRPKSGLVPRANHLNVNVVDCGLDKDYPIEPSPKVAAETSSSSIATVEPFIRQRRFRKQMKQNPTLIHFNSLFGNNDWSKYLILKTERNITPLKLEYHLLKKCPTKDISFRPVKENEWLIETTTIQQSENLLSMTNMEGMTVEVSRHANMNSIKGTVVLPRQECGDE